MMKPAGRPSPPQAAPFRDRPAAPSFAPRPPQGPGAVAAASVARLLPTRPRQPGPMASASGAAAAAAPGSNNNGGGNAEDPTDPAMLAPRSRRARQPALSYYSTFVRASADLWSPTENPNGYVVLSVAENRLSKRALADALAAAPRPPDDALGYQNFRGIDVLRAALAGVLQRTMLRRREGGEGDEQEQRRLANDMYLACGAGSVVDLLFHLLASPGDGVLIPAPYYPSFDNDLAVRDGVVPVPAFLDLQDGVDRGAMAGGGGGAAATDAAARAAAAGAPLAEQLEAAARAWEDEQARQQGQSGRYSTAVRPPHPKIRALLLTNPSNPLGTVLRRGQLLEAAAWAHGRGVHLVCDEIYGAMVWGEDEEDDHEQNDEQRFVSAWELLRDGTLARQVAAASSDGGTSPQARAEALTHVIWGLSKDFCASGLRVGVLLTRNPGVAAAWRNLSYFAVVAFPLQHALAAVLSDQRWVEAFWRGNRAALRASWRELTAALDAERIPYVEGSRAAMFCWVDLREGLVPTGTAEGAAAQGPDWEAERALWRALVDARVVVTPGEACHAPEPGFFRVCWAWMPREALPVAVRRVRGVLDAARERRVAALAGAAAGE